MHEHHNSHVSATTPQSVTALEFEAGALAHARALPKGGPPRAFVAVRNPTFCESVPEEHRTDFVAEDSRHEAALSELVDKVTAAGLPVLNNYAAEVRRGGGR